MHQFAKTSRAIAYEISIIFADLLALGTLLDGNKSHGRLSGDDGGTRGPAHGQRQALHPGGAAVRGVRRDAVRCADVRRHGGLRAVEAGVSARAAALRARGAEPRHAVAPVPDAGLGRVRGVVHAVHARVRGGRAGRRRVRGGRQDGAPLARRGGRAARPAHGQRVVHAPRRGAGAARRGRQVERDSRGAAGAGHAGAGRRGGDPGRAALPARHRGGDRRARRRLPGRGEGQPGGAERGSEVVLEASVAVRAGRRGPHPGEGPRADRDAHGALHAGRRVAPGGARLAPSAERGGDRAGARGDRQGDVHRDGAPPFEPGAVGGRGEPAGPRALGGRELPALGPRRGVRRGPLAGAQGPRPGEPRDPAQAGSQRDQERAHQDGRAAQAQRGGLGQRVPAPADAARGLTPRGELPRRGRAAWNSRGVGARIPAPTRHRVRVPEIPRRRTLATQRQRRFSSDSLRSRANFHRETVTEPDNADAQCPCDLLDFICNRPAKTRELKRSHWVQSYDGCSRTSFVTDGMQSYR